MFTSDSPSNFYKTNLPSRSSNDDILKAIADLCLSQSVNMFHSISIVLYFLGIKDPLLSWLRSYLID